MLCGRFLWVVRSSIHLVYMLWYGCILGFSLFNSQAKEALKGETCPWVSICSPGLSHFLWRIPETLQTIYSCLLLSDVCFVKALVCHVYWAYILNVLYHYLSHNCFLCGCTVGTFLKVIIKEQRYWSLLDIFIIYSGLIMYYHSVEFFICFSWPAYVDCRFTC